MDEYVCPVCGTEAAGRRVCASCGADLDAVASLPRRSEFEAGGIDAVTARHEQEVRDARVGSPAGVLIRWAAYILDNLVALAAALAAGFAASLLGASEDRAVTVGAIALTIGWILYPGLLTGLWNGQTLGKRAVGIRTELRDGRPIGVGRALLRESVIKFLFAWIPLGLVADAIVAGASAQKLSLHDLMVTTRVVRVR